MIDGSRVSSLPDQKQSVIPLNARSCIIQISRGSLVLVRLCRLE